MKTARIPMTALALAALLAGGACAANQAAADAAADQPSAEQQSESEEFVSTALVVGVSDGQALFVDQETEAVYFPTLPEGTPELAVGNVVRVTGNGIMLESYPGQYPGITSVEVIEEGSPEDAEKYAEVVNQVWAPRDPAQPPSAWVEYATNQALVTFTPYSCSYTWTYGATGTEKTVSVDAPHPTQLDVADLAGAQVSGAGEVTMTFDVSPVTAAGVTRWSEEELAGAEDPFSVEGETLELDERIMEGSSVTFAVESGYRYAVQAYFDAGDVIFVFTVN